MWDHLPGEIQDVVLDKELDLWVIDANRVAREAGMANRINTVMQPCFFVLSGVLPRDEAITAIKGSIERSYGKRGRAIVEQNNAAVDAALDALEQVAVPEPLGARSTAGPRCRRRRRTSCSGSRRGCWPARAICSRSAPYRSTARSRPGPPGGNGA